MANWTGAGAALSGGFMKAFEDRRKQAEEEQARRKQQEEIRNMMRSLGLGMPEGDIPVNMAGVVAQKGFNDQNMFRQEAISRQQSDAMKADIQQRYGLTLNPNVTLSEQGYNNLVRTLDDKKAQDEKRVGLRNTYNQIATQAKQYGLTVPDLGEGGEPTQDMIDYWGRITNDAYNNRARAESKPPTTVPIEQEAPSVDVTTSVNLVRGRIQLVQSVEELEALQKDQNFIARMKRIAQNSPETYQKIFDEIDTKEMQLLGIITTAQPAPQAQQQTGFNPQGMQSAPANMLPNVFKTLNQKTSNYGSGW